MPKRKTKAGPSKAVLLVLVMLSFGTVGVLARYVQMHPTRDLAPKTTTSDDALAHAPESARASHRTTKKMDADPFAGTVSVYAPISGNSGVEFEKRTLKIVEDTDPKVAAVNQFLADAKITDKNARLLSVDLRNGLAAMDFSEAFGQTQGTDDEATLIKGLQMNMGQFPEVKRIQLFIDGKPMDTLGNIDLSAPIDVIRPSSSDQ